MGTDVKHAHTLTNNNRSMPTTPHGMHTHMNEIMAWYNNTFKGTDHCGRDGGIKMHGAPGQAARVSAAHI